MASCSYAVYLQGGSNCLWMALCSHTYIRGSALWRGCKDTPKTLKEPWAGVIGDEKRFYVVRLSCPGFSGQSFRGARGFVYQELIPSTFWAWQHLIGVKENFTFSPQLLLFTLLPYQKMTHFSSRGLGNEINLLPYGLKFFNLLSSSCKGSAPASEHPRDRPDWINGDAMNIEIYFIYTRCFLHNISSVGLDFDLLWLCFVHVKLVCCHTKSRKGNYSRGSIQKP